MKAKIRRALEALSTWTSKVLEWSRWRELPEWFIGLGLYVWVVMGAQAFIAKNGWGLDKLLALIETNWKAALIVAVVLFHQTARLLLRRLRKGPVGMEWEAEPVVPLEQAKPEPIPRDS